MAVIFKPYEYNAALVRRPANSVVNGLRDGGGEDPTYEGVKAEHDSYIDNLGKAGVDVTVLPPLESFPDSVFVEDPALVFQNGAILLRPSAASRLGETEKIEPVLRERFDVVLELPSPGFADGGDVLFTSKNVMVGLSSRTDRGGAEGLQSCLAQLGYPSEIVATPEGMLHFKTACSLLDDEIVLTTKRLAASGVFRNFEQVIVPEGEEAAANALRVNNILLVGSGFPRTHELLEARGYNVVPVPTSEVAKIDAGLSCMSLRWQRAANSANPI